MSKCFVSCRPNVFENLFGQLLNESRGFCHILKILHPPWQLGNIRSPPTRLSTASIWRLSLKTSYNFKKVILMKDMTHLVWSSLLIEWSMPSTYQLPIFHQWMLSIKHHYPTAKLVYVSNMEVHLRCVHDTLPCDTFQINKFLRFEHLIIEYDHMYLFIDSIPHNIYRFQRIYN